MNWLLYIGLGLMIVVVLALIYVLYCLISNKQFISKTNKQDKAYMETLLNKKYKLNLFLNIAVKKVLQKTEDAMTNTSEEHLRDIIKKAISAVNKLLISIIYMLLKALLYIVILCVVALLIGIMFNTVATSFVTLFGDKDCECYARCTGDSDIDSKCSYELLFGEEEYSKLISAAGIPSDVLSSLNSYETGQQKGQLLINYVNDGMVSCYKSLVGENKGFKREDGQDRTTMSDSELRADLIKLLSDYKVNGVNPNCDCVDYKKEVLKIKCQGEKHYQSDWSWTDMWMENDKERLPKKKNKNTNNTINPLGHATPGQYTITLADGGTYYWYHQKSHYCTNDAYDDKFGYLSQIVAGGAGAGNMAAKGCSIYATAIALSNILDEEITPYVVIQEVLGANITENNGLYEFKSERSDGIRMYSGEPEMAMSTLSTKAVTLYGDKGLKSSVVKKEQAAFDDILVNKGGCIVVSVKGVFDWYGGKGHFLMIRKKSSDGLYYCVDSNDGHNDTHTFGHMNTGVTWETLNTYVKHGQGVAYWVEQPEVQLNTSGNGTYVSDEIAKSEVYRILSAHPSYSAKAVELATAYSVAAPAYGKNFALGLMANIKCEGSPGYVEAGMTIGNWNGDGVSRTSGYGKNALIVGSRANAEALLQPALWHYSRGANSNMYGVGIIQWTDGRRIEIVNRYLTNCTTYSIDEILDIEVEFMLYEFDTKERFKKVKEGANGSAYQNAYNICYYYEVPQDRDIRAVERGNIAMDLENVLSNVN